VAAQLKTSDSIGLVNLSRGTVIASDVTLAKTFLARGRGLMFRSSFPVGSALVIDPCSSIHMFFMRFPIDVLYMNREETVVRVQQSIKPWRVGPLVTRGAKFVIELPEGTIARTGTQTGDRVVIEKLTSDRA
jgi:uncharacterized protein